MTTDADGLSTPPSALSHHRDDPDELLSAAGDPGAVEFGASGSEAAADLNWFAMLRTKAQTRATSSDRYPWWVLSSLLAGLLALNITFTVFIVALPKVASEFNTSITVLTWTMTGPLYILGGILFGSATFRARVLPRWAGVLLAAGTAMGPLAALLPLDLQPKIAVPAGLALAWLG